MKEERDGWSPDDQEYQPDDEDDLAGMSHPVQPIRPRHVSSASTSSKRMHEVPLAGGSVEDGYRYVPGSHC